MNFNYQTCIYCQQDLVFRKQGSIKKTCLNCINTHQILVEYVAYLDAVWMEVYFYDLESQQINQFNIFESDRFPFPINLYYSTVDHQYWQDILTGKLSNICHKNKKTTMPFSIVEKLHLNNMIKTIRNYLLLK